MLMACRTGLDQRSDGGVFIYNCYGVASGLGFGKTVCWEVDGCKSCGGVLRLR